MNEEPATKVALKEEMVERVARAIFDSVIGQDVTHAETVIMARAAIEAMREPTEAMLTAGWYTDCLESGPHDSATIAWQAMIDAALQASEGGGSTP